MRRIMSHTSRQKRPTQTCNALQLALRTVDPAAYMAEGNVTWIRLLELCKCVVAHRVLQVPYDPKPSNLNPKP